MAPLSQLLDHREKVDLDDRRRTRLAAIVAAKLLRAVQNRNAEQVGEWMSDADRQSVFFELLLNALDYKSLKQEDVDWAIQAAAKADPKIMIDERGYPLTFAFEREMPTDEAQRALVYYYRLHSPDVSREQADQAWFEKDAKERFELLENNRHKFNSVTTTGLAPSSVPLSDISTESVNVGKIFEIKSRGFVMHPEQLKKVAEGVSADTGRWHAFHFHISFDRTEAEEAAFERFVMQLNQYLIARGIPVSEYMSAPSAPKELRKFLPAGLRMKIYGRPYSQNSERIGIELRDVISGPDGFEELYAIAKAVQKRAWTRWNIDSPLKFPDFRFGENNKSPLVAGMKEKIMSALKSGLADPNLSEKKREAVQRLILNSERVFLRFNRAHGYWAMPLFFEIRDQSLFFTSGERFFDSDGNVRKSLPLSRGEIQVEESIRQQYEKDIVDLMIELDLAIFSGDQELQSEDMVRSALNMILGTWSKKSNAKRLLQPF